MTEQIESTQPSTPPQPDDTQPIGKVKKKINWKSIAISILGFLLLIGLGGFSGYSSGLNARQNAESEILDQQLSEQFSFALVDIQFGRYENARQRLEFIISKNPSFPGAQEKLTEVLVASSIPTAAPTITPTVTPDFSGAESAFSRAKELIRLQDWSNALGALDTIRKLDPTYKTAQVDGMYYFALRNNGYDLITKQGNLEGGIYFLTLAERFGPLDNTAVGLRDGARAYITGASFWELDWEQAVNYFSQVGAGWPSLWDGTMTASQRYFFALMRYGDDLFAKQSFCDANSVYQEAALIGVLDATAANNAARALNECNASIATAPPIEASPTDTATEPPTEAPTP
jgi:tetratricopeptide (TPR) repeat protein